MYNDLDWKNTISPLGSSTWDFISYRKSDLSILGLRNEYFFGRCYAVILAKAGIIVF
jgi:hypothetical protein